MGLCFGGAAGGSLGVGQCVARPAAGTLQVNIGATAFTAEQVAAIVDGEYVQISARAGLETIVLNLPAKLGPASCETASYVGSFLYYRDGAPDFVNQSTTTGPRPSCTVNVTKVGGVGERIEGTFSATVAEAAANPRQIELANGTFSVARVVFP